MGIACKGPAHTHVHDQSALANSAMPDSSLKRKSSSLACHLVREGVAMDDRRKTHVNSHENEVELLSKVLHFVKKRRKFVRKV